MEFDVVERHKCPTCSSKQSIVLFSTYDDRYGQPDMFTVLECKKCGTCYIREAIVPEQLGSLYKKYYGHNPVSDSHIQTPKAAHRVSSLSKIIGLIQRRLWIRTIYEVWFRAWTAERVLDWAIHRNECVLDVGCGNGHLAEPVMRRGARWTGLEIDPVRCQTMRDRGLGCLCGTLETVKLPEGSYDSIIASQVIEHASDPKQFLMHCVKVLQSGGRVLVSTPNAASRYRRIYGQNWIHWFVPYHQVLFQVQSLKNLAQQCGLEMHKYRTETPSTWGQLQLNYQRPPRGEIGVWRNRGAVSRLQPDMLSLSLRLGDIFQGNGDALIAELVKP